MQTLMRADVMAVIVPVMELLQGQALCLPLTLVSRLIGMAPSTAAHQFRQAGGLAPAVLKRQGSIHLESRLKSGFTSCKGIDRGMGSSIALRVGIARKRLSQSRSDSSQMLRPQKVLYTGCWTTAIRRQR